MPSLIVGDDKVTFHLGEDGKPVLISAVPAHSRVDRRLLPKCSGFCIRRDDPTRFAGIMKAINKLLK